MNKNIIRVAFLVIVLVGGFIAYQYSTPDKSSVEYTLKKLDEKIILPNNQSPQIARIETEQALAEVRAQPFFQNTMIGDSLVVYPDRVIVYRPSTEKIVTMGIISPEKSAEIFNTVPSVPSETTTPTSAAVQVPITVEIRNGTAVKGLAKKVSDMITVISGVTVPTTGNASTKTYTKTTIVNTSNKSISQVEKILGTTAVTTLPAGEKSSTADVLIIVGADKSTL